MVEKSQNQRSLIISYLMLRRIVGGLGVTLPLVVFFGALIIFGTGLQSSMSAYYYTGMRNVFVGTMCIIGFFLLSYRGYEGIDNIAGSLACVFAIGVALFPTAPDGVTSGAIYVTGLVHLIFASLFFITLICFSLFLFTKTDEKVPMTVQKKDRNKVYRTCGYAMSICVLLMVIWGLLPNETASRLAVYCPLFWLEALAIIAFGISWLIKGEWLLTDKAK